MKKIKILILMLCFLALSFSLFSCVDKDDFASEIKIQQSIVLDDDIVELPAISLIYTSGKTEQASYSDFWFESKYTFVQANKIIIKEGSPAEFNDTLTIKLRENTTVTAEMELIKHYIPLSAISISTATGKDECISGESVKIVTEFFPKNASNKEILFEILEGGEFAEITDKGVLSVKKDTPANSQIVLKGYSNEGFFSELVLSVAERIKIFNATQFATIKNNPDGDYSLEADIDFKELSHKLPIPEFGGTLSGNGYDILNFKIEIISNGFSRDKFFGLFGQMTGFLENFNIKNSSVIFSDQNINAQNGAGNLSAGIVAGGGSGEIRNICIYNSKVEVYRDRSRIGGLAGDFSGRIENCSVYGITLYSGGDIGGIVGVLSRGFIGNCRLGALKDTSRNTIWHYSTDSERSIGGLIGFSIGGTLEYSHVFNTDFILDGDIISESIQVNAGYGVGHQHAGRIHLINCGAMNDNTKTTTKDASVDTWQRHYFKLAFGQIGNVSSKPDIT